MVVSRNFIRGLLPRRMRQSSLRRGRKLLNRFGCDLLNALDPIDLRGLGLNVEEAQQRAGRLPFVIDVPVEHVRHMGAAAFPIDLSGGSPFVDTAFQYLHNPDLTYEGSALKVYYDSFQPQDVGDFLGLPRSPDRHFLLNQHRVLTFFPWQRPPLKDYQHHIASRLSGVTLENEEHGVKLDHSHGLVASGPVSPQKGELELLRIKRVVNSLRKEGFRIAPNVTPIRVQALRHGDAFRYFCRAGNHRSTTFVALGGTALPVWPYPTVVNRDDVDRWPGVVEKVFTRDEALFVFDRVFEGRQPDPALTRPVSADKAFSG